VTSVDGRVTETTLDAAGRPLAAETSTRAAPAGYWRGVARRLRYDYVTLLFIALIAAIALAAIFAPLIAPFDPYKSSMIYRLKPIGYRGFLLGTDELGRDMLSRLTYGGRSSLMMGLTPVILATAIGGSLGLVAGYLGGWVNALIMRTMDVFYAFPSVLLAVAISGTLGGGVVNGLIALTLVFIPPLCRVAEGATTQIRDRDFVEAARASGASATSIIFYHVLRNVSAPVLIYASSLISVSILLAAGLSFLGLGVEPPTADWGLMLSTLRQSIYVQPLICALPGLAIFIVSLSFNLVSDGLRQAMDVRS
jgi:peptide/nickel transport system permease protein